MTASVLALGAGAYAREGLREPRWSFPVYAVAVGTSLNVTQIAVGRADNLIVDGLAMALAAVALGVAAGERGTIAGMLLLTAAVVTHWSMAIFFAALLVAFALLLLPESWGTVRRGEGILATPSARLALLLAGSAAAGGAALALGQGPPELPKGGVGPVPARKLESQGPRFAAMAPPALLGALAGLFPRDVWRRRGFLFALLWAATGLAGLIVFLPLGFQVLPAHRIVPIALGIPLLAAAAVVFVARMLARMRPEPLGVALGALAVATALAVGTGFAREVWEAPPPGQAEMFRESVLTARYLAGIEGDDPVVVVAGRPGRRDPGQIVRAGLLADQIPRVRVFLGKVEDLLAGRPTVDPENESYTARSLRHWEAIEPILDRDPIVLVLSSLNRGRSLAEGTEVAPGVTVIRGPPPTGEDGVPDAPAPPSSSRMVAIVLFALALFGGVGLGWSFSLLRAEPLVRVALAPALGIAVLAVGGTLAARVGIDGPGSRPALAAVLAAAGWLPVVAETRWKLGRSRGAHARVLG